MRNVLLFLLLILPACGSGPASSRPAGVPAPEVEVRQTNPIFFGSGYSAPVIFEVGIRNSGAQPLKVREIEISAPGMAEYSVAPVRQIINDTLGAGEAKVCFRFGRRR